MKIYQNNKRIFDFILSFIAMLILWPFFLVIAFLIKLDSEGPIFFKQKRIGKNKKEFYILKFRTMKTNTPNDTTTHLLQDPHLFITKFGKFLRRSSLDELPQIINILKGEMSIVGPRPALYNQFDLIKERDKYRANDIYQGLTGWAQINGRDELTIEVKARFDGEYVERRSFAFDWKILLITIFRVLSCKGIREGVIEESDID